MSKILVSGHLGFVGQHLCRKLVDNGYRFENVDLKNGRDIRNLIPEDLQGFEYVIHLAAQAKVPLSIEKPLFTNAHNIDGTLNLLWCAKEAKVRRFIYSSSSSVYGNQDKLPLTEDMIPNPMSPYATQKLTGEYYCKNFSDLYGLETVSLRYFNIYGENMPLDGAYSACIARFLDQKKQDKPLTIYGGEQTRDFTYVGDVVFAIMSAMHSPKIGKGEIINIGGGKNHSINEIAKAISTKHEHSPQRKGEPQNTLADISKANELLKWIPETELIQWLKNTDSVENN